MTLPSPRLLLGQLRDTKGNQMTNANDTYSSEPRTDETTHVISNRKDAWRLMRSLESRGIPAGYPTQREDGAWQVRAIHVVEAW